MTPADRELLHDLFAGLRRMERDVAYLRTLLESGRESLPPYPSAVPSRSVVVTVNLDEEDGARLDRVAQITGESPEDLLAFAALRAVRGDDDDSGAAPAQVLPWRPRGVDTTPLPAPNRPETA